MILSSHKNRNCSNINSKIPNLIKSNSSKKLQIKLATKSEQAQNPQKDIFQIFMKASCSNLQENYLLKRSGDYLTFNVQNNINFKLECFHLRKQNANLNQIIKNLQQNLNLQKQAQVKFYFKEIQTLNKMIQNLNKEKKSQQQYYQRIIQEKEDIIKKMVNFNDFVSLKLIQKEKQLNELLVQNNIKSNELKQPNSHNQSFEKQTNITTKKDSSILTKFDLLNSDKDLKKSKRKEFESSFEEIFLNMKQYYSNEAIEGCSMFQKSNLTLGKSESHKLFSCENKQNIKIKQDALTLI